MKLLDTSVAVDHLRGDQAAVDLLQGLVEQDEVLVASEIVRFELAAGVRDDELPALEQFFSAVSWVAIGEEVARTAGGLARKYRRANRGIDDADYLIAATALLLDAELLTTNVRHFPMLPGLQPPYRTPVFAWASGTRLFVHSGIDPAAGEQEIGAGPACCYYSPEVATDEATKKTTVAYGSLVRGKTGLFVRAVEPTLGAPTLVPKSTTARGLVLPDSRLPLVARQGGGVFLAYCGGYPTCKQVHLWKVGGGAPATVASASYVEDVNVSRGPEGRIWVMW